MTPKFALFIKNLLVFCTSVIAANWLLWWIALPVIFWSKGHGLDVFMEKTYSPVDLSIYVLATVFPPVLAIGLLYAAFRSSPRWLRARFVGSLVGSATSIWLFMIAMQLSSYGLNSRSHLPISDYCYLGDGDFCSLVPITATALAVIVLAALSGAVFSLIRSNVIHRTAYRSR